MKDVIDFSKLFQVKYILSSNTGYQFKFLIPALIIFSAIIVSGLASWYVLRQKELIYKKLAGQLLSFGLTIGLLGLLLIFFRFEALPYLSIRIWLILLLLTFVSWGGYILVWSRLTIPKVLSQNEQRKNFEKYLPKKKQK